MLHRSEPHVSFESPQRLTASTSAKGLQYGCLRCPAIVCAPEVPSCDPSLPQLETFQYPFEMAPRKRGRDEMESSEPPKETKLLDKIRNMWEFACVMQFIFTFGKIVKIDEDFDIEVPA
jgi:hypothetical protein